MSAAEDFARALKAERYGKQKWLARCPAHDDATPSLSISEGKTVDIVLHCHAGCKQAAVISALRARGIWPCTKDSTQSRESINHHPIAHQHAPEQDWLKQRALAVFNAAKPIIDTPADAYLLARGIDIIFDLPPSALADLRFHSACPRGPGAGGAKGMTQPAMVALLRDVMTGEPMAIHRTFLRGIAKDGRAMLGPCDGSAVMLTPFDAIASRDGTDAFAHLQLTEGIETGLAVMRRFGGHVWATGTAPKIKTFPVLPFIRALTVRADHDENGTGADAAEVLVARYREHGIPADWTMPEAINSDYADERRRHS